MQALLLQFWELKIKCNFRDERLMNSLRRKWRHLQLKVSGNFSFHFSLSTLTSYITRRDADQIFTLNFYFQISKEKNSSCDGHETIEDAVFMNEFSIRRFMTSRKQSRFTFKIKLIFFFASVGFCEDVAIVLTEAKRWNPSTSWKNSLSHYHEHFYLIT